MKGGHAGGRLVTWILANVAAERRSRILHQARSCHLSSDFVRLCLPLSFGALSGMFVVKQENYNLKTVWNVKVVRRSKDLHDSD